MSIDRSAMLVLARGANCRRPTRNLCFLSVLTTSSLPLSSSYHELVWLTWQDGIKTVSLLLDHILLRSLLTGLHAAGLKLFRAWLQLWPPGGPEQTTWTKVKMIRDCLGKKGDINLKFLDWALQLPKTQIWVLMGSDMIWAGKTVVQGSWVLCSGQWGKADPNNWSRVKVKIQKHFRILSEQLIL